MTAPASSSKWAHPPRSNRPRSSSSGPPGACMTPSTEICFAVSATDLVKTDLMGFEVTRTDQANGHRATMHNVKVFQSLIPHPTATTWEPTSQHPIQTFVWDDFNVDAGHAYLYEFTPLT